MSLSLLKYQSTFIAMFYFSLIGCSVNPRDIIVIDYYNSPTNNHFYSGKAIVSTKKDTVFVNKNFTIDSIYKTGEWKEMLNGNIKSVYTYEDNKKDGMCLLFDDNSYLNTRCYYKNNQFSNTDTLTNYFPARLQISTPHYQCYGVLPGNGNIINLWDVYGNRLIENGKPFWIDYFNKEKQKFNIDQPAHKIENISWINEGNAKRWNKDSTYYEEMMLAVEIDNFIPIANFLLYELPDSTYKSFYYVQGKTPDATKIVITDIYSCDSIRVRQFNTEGICSYDELMNYGKLKWDIKIYSTLPDLLVNCKK